MKEILTDASVAEWGVSCTNETAHNFWNNRQRKTNIYFLELKTALFDLKCFTKNLTYYNILLRIDNTTAMSNINGMARVKFENLYFIAKKIWTTNDDD